MLMVEGHGREVVTRCVVWLKASGAAIVLGVALLSVMLRAGCEVAVVVLVRRVNLVQGSGTKQVRCRTTVRHCRSLARSMSG